MHHLARRRLSCAGRGAVICGATVRSFAEAWAGVARGGQRRREQRDAAGRGRGCGGAHGGRSAAARGVGATGATTPDGCGATVAGVVAFVAGAAAWALLAAQYRATRPPRVEEGLAQPARRGGRRVRSGAACRARSSGSWQHGRDGAGGSSIPRRRGCAGERGDEGITCWLGCCYAEPSSE
eukprot:2947440-Pleurochrysis_carterae.AAC.1